METGMTYRNIIVDGQQFKYVVGKSHVKIRGFQAIKKEDIGQEVDVRCSCCGMTMEEIYGYPSKSIEVYPSHIAKYIKRSYSSVG